MSSPRPRLAALAVTLRPGEVLLVRRRNPPDQGLWGYPGGKVEYGETVFEAAARELREETGLQAEPRQSLGHIDLIYRDAEGAVLHHFFLIAVLCGAASGELLAADDAEEAAWFGVEQVLSGDLPLSKDVARLLRIALGADAPV